ncbi:hypothetical protein AB0F03_05600 [Streptomyces sp. NPDC028722]|uniref:hypothetical protein n=1 Tax=Streptomyces sp. NPDC028722 TaxID=3155016 RepID=UPI0033C892B7
MHASARSVPAAREEAIRSSPQESPEARCARDADKPADAVLGTGSLDRLRTALGEGRS